MTIFDVTVRGQKSETKKLTVVAAKVGQFLRLRFEPDEDGEFLDWTGISNFSVFDRPEEYRFRAQTIIEEGSRLNLLEWIDAPLKDDEVAIYWPQIDSPQRFPTETCEFMLKEAKNLQIENIVEFLIQEWNTANIGLARGFGKLVRKVAVFNFLGNEFRASCTRRVP